MIQLKKWFFTVVLQKNRFKNYDKPDEQTFQNLTDSVTFKLEKDDRAKTNDQSLAIDSHNLQGLVVMSTDQGARSRNSEVNIISGNPDRSTAVKPEQLPSSVAINDPNNPWVVNPLVSQINNTITTREHTEYYLNRSVLTAYIQANSTQLWYWDINKIRNVSSFQSTTTQWVWIDVKNYQQVGIHVEQSGYIKIGNNGADLDIDPPQSPVGLYVRKMTSMGINYYSRYRLCVGGSNGYYGNFSYPNYNGFPFARPGNGIDKDQEENCSIAIHKGILRLSPWEELNNGVAGSKDAFTYVGTNVVDNNSYTYRTTQIGGVGFDKPFAGTITWMPGTDLNTNQTRGIAIMPIPAFNCPSCGDGCPEASDVRELTFTQSQEHQDSLNFKFQKSIFTVQTAGGIKLHELNPFYQPSYTWGYGDWGHHYNKDHQRNVIFISDQSNETFSSYGRYSWVGRPLWYGHYTNGASNTYQKLEFVMQLGYAGGTQYPQRPPLSAHTASSLSGTPTTATIVAAYNQLLSDFIALEASYNQLLSRLFETNLFRE
jgi:hypothetical protein